MNRNMRKMYTEEQIAEIVKKICTKLYIHQIKLQDDERHYFTIKAIAPFNTAISNSNSNLLLDINVTDTLERYVPNTSIFKFLQGSADMLILTVDDNNGEYGYFIFAGIVSDNVTEYNQ